MRRLLGRRLPSLRTIALGAGILAALGLVAIGLAVEGSSQPEFCGSCHVMTPYYQSWQRSSHRNVACVECHIAPGVRAGVHKKYEALSMVARYFTGTYSANPWTEVEDAACLRCHERRLLGGRELFGKVYFDHSPHFGTLRGGVKLRCTSCHAQIERGDHIAVSPSTCVLCHFKDRESNVGSAACTLCHAVPETQIQRGSLTFNHADVRRFGMNCASCHARPEDSGGRVPRERCVTCHNEEEVIEAKGQPEKVHEVHLVEHKVDCLNCHLEINHVGEPSLEHAASTCDSCHQQGHSPQLSLYTGQGGRGVEPMPSGMFQAGVRCEGCHIPLPGNRDEAVRTANDVSCMTCHGPGYQSIYRSWKQETVSRVSALTRQLDATRLALSPDSTALNDATANLSLVERGNSVHNLPYAFALLSRAHRDMNQARQERGLPTLPLPWKELPGGSPCVSCHLGAGSQSGEIFGRGFSHAKHVQDEKIDCQRCHRPHAERPPDEVVRFGAGGCESCHHEDIDDDCLACHDPVMTRTVKSALGNFPHEHHVKEEELGCKECHKLEPDKPVVVDHGVCETCHEE